ncbi:hypothetical protein FB45DRAFT_974495 [Roridomyces roridus]|uniref:NAD(P)-binding protein n=1 Tax=Roridomyces roridus TaxID=1738132 RepID=A0AAD7CJU3_9AGAR|nr:hypothetical protein FB45DRAFT_974495 [Roridomyces roridus]
MAKFTFTGFVRDQYAKRPPVTKVDLTGKTVLVVGANAGLGFETSKHLATMNPGRLILACRSQSKGQEAVENIKKETGCTTVELWIVDLADFASVRRFADKFDQDGGRLDYFVANAAVILPRYERTKDGYETCIQVNCFALPLLSFLLLPHMIRTAREHSSTPRIVFVASEVHFMAKVEKQILESPEILKTLASAEYCTPKRMEQRYFLTKLLNVFFVRAFNDHLAASTPLIVNAVTPGFCYSNIRTTFTGLMAVMDFFMEVFFALPTEVGSRQLVWAAVGGEPNELRGQYINRQRVEECSDFVLSPEGKRMQDRIWDEMLEMLSKVDERVISAADIHLRQ